MKSITNPTLSPNLVFVYGTLKTGFGLNHAMKDCELLGKATLPGYAMVSLGSFPGITPDHTATPITGEVYAADQETIDHLDQIESEGSLYIRKREKVLLKNSDAVRYFHCVSAKWVEVWVYVFNRDTGEHRSVVPSGEWTDKNEWPQDDGDAEMVRELLAVKRMAERAIELYDEPGAGTYRKAAVDLHAQAIQEFSEAVGTWHWKWSTVRDASEESLDLILEVEDCLERFPFYPG